MRRLVPLAILVLLVSVPAAGQPARRGVPRAMRAALIGCWDLGGDEVHVIEAQGARGLRSRWRAPGENGRERYAESMFYRADEELVEGGCGARSQHGQFCLFRVTGDRVEVSMVSRYSGGVASVREAHRCADDVTVEETEASLVPVPADAPVSVLLGARRPAIDAGRAPTGEEEGWVRYGGELAILYEAGVAMRVRRTITASDCEEAARLAGYAPPEGSAPLRRADGCEWPGISDRHRLAPHVAASFRDGVFEVWRR